MLPTSSRPSKFENEHGNFKKKNISKDRNFCFYECVRPVLLCCKLIGFLPLDGLIISKHKVARFSWKSFYTCVYLPNLIWTMFCSLDKCINKLAFGIERKDISGLVFSLNTLFSSVLMIKLAIKWNEILLKIEDLERLLPYPKTSKPMKTIRRIIFVILLSASVEFTMYIINTAFSAKDKLQPNDHDSCFKYFFTTAYDWFFDNISFHCVLGYLLLFSKLQATCLRNLTDIFVISVAIYLCARFAHFNRLLLQEEKKVNQLTWMPWADLQKHYTRLTYLVLLLDELINPFIFVSFSCNVIFICKQIFYIIHVDWEPVLYLAFSTAFVVLRAIVVSLYLAHHQTLTRMPLSLLHTVPASTYNYKMQCFMDQVFHSKLGLSGFKLFYVTRESILSMLATIITYEMVLLQFPER